MKALTPCLGILAAALLPCSAQVVINEVDSDTPGSDTAEFIELFDGGAGNTPLDGYVLVFFNGSNDSSYAAFDLDGFQTSAEGFFVVGNPGVPNVGLTFDPGPFGFLQNGADAVALYLGDAADFPNGTPPTTSNLVDAIVYDTNDADDAGLLAGLGQTIQYNEAENGDSANESISRLPDGDANVVTKKATPGAPNAGPPDPVINSLSPTNGATGLPASGITQLEAVFSRNVVAGTGSIVIRDASDNSVVESFDVETSFDIAIGGTNLFIFSSPFGEDSSYWVEIPATAILAEDDGTPFAGFTDASGWSFSTAAAPTPPTVVVNKYDASGPPDMIELLVIGDQTPGNTVDLQGMILKDFSRSMGRDGGGKFEFTSDPLWAAVPVGTQIVLTSRSSAANDVDPTDDFVIDVGLDNETYFTSLTGTLDLSNTEMVMIKEAGSGAAVTTGGIHALAGGTPGSFYNNFGGNKTLAGIGGNGVIALNPTGSIADFTGESFDAEGGQSLSSSAFGAPNTGTNAAFIAALRGTNPADGDGTATLVNVTTGSPFENLGFFDKGQTGRTALISLFATVPSVTLTDIEIEVPTAAVGGISGADVALLGPGAAGATVSVAGSTITVSNAAVTTTDELQVVIGGLDTPVPSGAAADGNYPFVVSTTGGGTLAPVTSSPAMVVVIPIASLRDVDADGIALDLGKTVAIEGVCTEEDFGNTGTNNFSGFLQDATAGMNIYSPVEDPAFIRGNRYAVFGRVEQFNGLTEVVPASAADIVDLGADTEPAPIVLGIPALLADAETYEGSLVTVTGLSRPASETDVWAPATTITLEDAGGNRLDIRIQGGSSALTEPSYPAQITGVLGQFDPSSGDGRLGGYQLMPRDELDVGSAPTPVDFASWAAANGIPGEPFDGDFDGDGISNGVEYSIAGLVPTAADSLADAFDGTTLSFTKRPEAVANGDVIYLIEESTDLGLADDWSEVSGAGYTNDGTTISYLLPTGATRTFTRLRVLQAVVAP